MRDWRVNLAAAWLAQFLYVVGVQVSIPFMPLFLQELGTSDPQHVQLWTGALSSATPFAMALVAPFWGILADRHGRKLMVQRATFGSAVVLGLMFFARNAQQLFALRLVQGAVAGSVAAFLTLVSAFVPESHTGFALGLMQMAFYAGGSVGPLIGGVIADNTGYRSAFAVTAGLLFLAGVLVRVLVREGPYDSDPESSRYSLSLPVRIIVGSKPVFAVIVVLGVVYTANTVSGPYVPLLVRAMQADSALVGTWSGLVYGATATGSAISAMLAGRLSDQIGYRRIMLACSLTAVLAFAGQAVAPSVAVLAISALVSGLSLGGLLTSANTALARHVPRSQRGAVYGISSSVNAVGRASGPLIGAMLAVQLGLKSAFVMAATLFAMVALLVSALIRPEAGNVSRVSGNSGDAYAGKGEDEVIRLS